MYTKKKHNLLSPIKHRANTRHTVNKLSIEWLNKISSRKTF